MKHLPHIEYKTIPHKEQRYDTAGDYFNEYKIDRYRVSKLYDGWRAELAVLVHEIVEFQLCKEAKIKEQDITKFDIESNHADPGTLRHCPYYKQHKIATKIERYIIKELGLDWMKYDESFNKLKYKKS